MVSIPFLKQKEKKWDDLTDSEKIAKYDEMDDKEKKSLWAKLSENHDKLILLGLGPEEKYEEYWYAPRKTKFPVTKKTFRFQISDPNTNAMKQMNFFLTLFGLKLGFDKTYKVNESMGLPLGGSMFGNIAARLSAQQNQASQYMKGISEMIKGMFQIVREVRVIDERLKYYKDATSKDSNLSMSSDIVLKGIWVDQVEGGSKNPSSVYGLSNTVGFTILPDLFFRTKPISKDQIEKTVKNLRFNEKVKEVLMRKLRQYYEWREHTEHELKTRRKFVLNYLRQHYNTIRLYTSWVKPYLENVNKLKEMTELNKGTSVNEMMEQTLLEHETLSVRSSPEFRKSKAVVSVRMELKITPDMGFHSQEYQHKGPIHKGRVRFNVRAYSWTEDQVQAFLKYRKGDAMDLLKEYDSSIKDAMESLGAELDSYLKEAGDPGFLDMPEKKPSAKKVSGPSIFQPFIGVVGGFGEMFASFVPKGIIGGGKKKEKPKPPKQKDINSSERAANFAVAAVRYGYQKWKEQKGCFYW